MKHSAMKYELTTEVMQHGGAVLHRIRALRPFTAHQRLHGNPFVAKYMISKGDLGGWVESEDNLSQEGSCWIADDAMSYGNGKVTGDAYICGHAVVFGNAVAMDAAEMSGSAAAFGYAKVKGHSRMGDFASVLETASVSGRACLFGNAGVLGNARIYGDAVVTGETVLRGDDHVSKPGDYILFKNTWSSFRYFTYCVASGQWHVGCFDGTGKELVKKARKDSPLSGKMYGLYVTLTEKMQKEMKKKGGQHAR